MKKEKLLLIDLNKKINIIFSTLKKKINLMENYPPLLINLKKIIKICLLDNSCGENTIFKLSEINTDEVRYYILDNFYSEKYLYDFHNKKIYTIDAKFNDSQKLLNELKQNLDLLKLFFYSNEKIINKCFEKMYEYSLLEERKNDVIEGQMFEEYYDFSWVWPNPELNIYPSTNYHIFDFMRNKFVDGLCELLEIYNGLILSDHYFKNELKNFFSKENKEFFIKIWLFLLKELYMRNIVYWGAIWDAEYGRDYSFENLFDEKLFKFIFKLDVFTKEEITTMHYIQTKMYSWAQYRDMFARSGYNFDMRNNGTELMRRNICKNLSVAPLEYCLPGIDIYEVYQKILKNKEWKIHLNMLLPLQIYRFYRDKNYSYCFNYDEIEKIEQLNDFYWEEFLKCVSKEKEEKTNEKYWYLYGEDEPSNEEIDKLYFNFNKDQKIMIKNFYLTKDDCILGEEWKEQIKNWGDSSDYFVEEEIKLLKYFGWDWYKSTKYLEFTFEEFQELCRDYWGVELKWEEVNRNKFMEKFN